MGKKGSRRSILGYEWGFDNVTLSGRELCTRFLLVLLGRSCRTYLLESARGGEISLRSHVSRSRLR